MSTQAPFTFSHVIDAIHAAFPSAKVSNLYLWGSRLYGTALPSSDFDFNAVVCESGASVAARDKFSTADAETQFAVFDNGTINATLIPGAEFVARAREHRHDILECIATRDKTNAFLELEPVKMQLDVDVLRRTATWQSKRRFHVAVHAAERGIDKGKKEIIHSMRYLMFAMQIISQGSIYNTGEANELYHQIMAEASLEWQHYVDKYEPIRKRLSDKLQAMTTFRDLHNPLDLERKCILLLQAASHFTPSLNDSLFNEAVKHIFANSALGEALVDAGSISCLAQKYQLIVQRHPQHPNIIYMRQSVRSISVHVPLGKILISCLKLQPYAPQCLPDNLISLKYGLIVDAAYSYQVVWDLRQIQSFWQQPFFALELIDGIDITTLFYSETWIHVTSYGFIELCNVELGSRKHRDTNPISLRTEYLRILESDNRIQKLDPSVVYGFAMVSRNHRFIVGYEAERELFLTSCFRLKDATRCDIEETAKLIGSDLPTVYPLSERSEEVVKALVAQMNPFKCKGVNWQGTAYLAPQYASIVLASDLSTLGRLNMLGDLEQQTFMRLLQSNKAQTFVQLFPQWKALCDPFITQYESMTNIIQQAYDENYGLLSDGVSEAQAASKLKNTFYKTVVFAMKQQKMSSVRLFLALSDAKFFSGLLAKYAKQCK